MKALQEVGILPIAKKFHRAVVVTMLLSLLARESFAARNWSFDPKPTPIGSQGFQGARNNLFTGTAGYDIEIPVPPGTNGIEPQLVLQYSSSGKDSWTGYGWDLSLGKIERSIRKGLPQFNDQDIFEMTLNGAFHELVLFSGSEWRTKQETFLRVLKSGNDWIVTDPEGTQYEFRASVSRNGVPFSWGLTAVQDTQSNRMEITYDQSESVLYMNQIRYTLNSGISGERSIAFNTQSRADQVERYHFGVKQKITRLLSEIQLKINGAIIQSFRLSYVASPVGKSHLSKVEQIASDGTSKIQLASMEYHFNPTNLGFSSASTQSRRPSWVLSDRSAFVGEVNGDGFPDMIWVGGDTVRIALGDGKGWASAYERVIPGFSADFALERDPAVSVIISTLGDVNGDGIVDAVRGTALDWRYALGNGDSWGPTISVPNSSSWPAFINFDKLRTQLGDVNGDGRDDIIFSHITNEFTGGGADYRLYYWIALSNGNGWNDPVRIPTVETTLFNFHLGIRNNINRTAYLVDFNGDGMVDLFTFLDATTPAVMFSNGTGFTGEVVTLGSVHSNFYVFYGGTKFADLNHDGFVDLVSGTLFNGFPVYKVSYGNGKSLAPTVDLGVDGSMNWALADSYALIIDCNGDAVPDNLEGLNYRFASLPTDQLRSGLMKSVTDQYGRRTLFEYDRASSFAGNQLPFELPVTKKIQEEVSPSPTEVQEFSYAGGLYDRNEKEFRGFRTVEEKDASGNKAKAWFHQDESKLGLIEREERRSSADALYLETKNTYQADGSAPFYTPLIEEDVVTYDGNSSNKTKRTNFEYDSYGNVLKQSELGDVSNVGDERYTFFDYVPNSNAWIIKLPSRRRIFDNGAATGNPLALTEFVYDNQADWTTPPQKGDLTMERKWLNTQDRFPETHYRYDPYGNRVEVIDALNRSTVTTYDNAFQTFPVQIRNAIGQDELRTYFDQGAGFGHIKTVTDLNSQTTSYEYDIFGRLMKVVGPNDATSTFGSVFFEYGLVGSGLSSNYLVKRETETSGTGDHRITTQVFDGLNRLIQEAKEAEGSKTAIVTTQYDNRGLVSRVSLPVLRDGLSPTSYISPDSSWNWITNVYDPLGRMTQVTNPDSSVVLTAYDDWVTTVTDENNHVKRFTDDGLNRLVQVEEFNTGSIYTTQYRYDLLDRLTGITDHMGNVWTYVYDSTGRKVSEDDPDLGSSSFQYDDNGNLKQKTDVLNRVITHDYDYLNRLIAKDYLTTPGVDYLYFYDEPNSTFGIGRRTRLVDPSGETRFHYDNEGRTIKKVVSIVGLTDPFTAEWTYDAMDRVKKIIYPNAREVDFTYNDQGLIENISGFVTNMDYTALNHEKKIEFMNGRAVDFAYKADNQRLLRIQTSSLMDFNYQYDFVGNITQVRDDTKGWVKNYFYDDLDRLTSGDDETFSYDAIGNMTTHNGLPQLYEGLQPHALTNDGDNAYAYDDVGNMIGGAGRAFFYDAENRPVTITMDGVTTQFVYNGDGGRTLKIVSDGLSTKKTVYIDELYEKEIVL